MADKYRKKPVVVEAEQFTGSNWPTMNQFVGKTFKDEDGEMHWGFAPTFHEDEREIVAIVWDKLHSTWVGVKVGQFIIKGIQGEFYPCDEEVFHNTYDKVVAEGDNGG
jgi:hypothetical protein